VLIDENIDPYICSDGFIDVYREIVAALPLEHLSEQLIKIGSGSGASITMNPMFIRAPGVVAALLAIRRGEIESGTTALQWLKAQPGLTSTDLHRIGVTYRIKTTEDAIHTLQALTKLATYHIPNARLVILIDEYQRIGELKTSSRFEINAGMHTFYNANPTALSIILSFSFGNKENVAFLLSNELKSRSEPEAISLDVLNREQAVDFLRDLLAQFRIEQDGRWAFPFSPQGLHTLIDYIAQRKSLTPRRLMLYANHVLTEHEINNPDSDKEIHTSEVSIYLKNPQLGDLDTDTDV
jgi:hypothetical protein